MQKKLIHAGYHDSPVAVPEMVRRVIYWGAPGQRVVKLLNSKMVSWTGTYLLRKSISKIKLVKILENK